MSYEFYMYRMKATRAIQRGWYDAPKVKDHFLMACFDADLDPETAATLFRLLVKYESVEEAAA